MVAHLLRDVAVLLVVPDVLKRLALKTDTRESAAGKSAGGKDEKRTSMGLNGFAMRPIVDE